MTENLQPTPEEIGDKPVSEPAFEQAAGQVSDPAAAEEIMPVSDAEHAANLKKIDDANKPAGWQTHEQDN